MKITIIYDNTAYRESLQSDWGFSCLVEVENTPRILFDTGGNGRILLSNMEKLNINPKSINEVFISHAHLDHTGGLSDFLQVNPEVKVYVPISYPKPSKAKEVISVKQSLQLHENVFSTGEIDHIEQSMAIKIDKGIVLVVGCSHPKMAHILKAASQFGKVYGIVGGLHGFNEFELFKDLKLICPTHCTQHKAKIRFLYPEKYIEDGAGRVIEI
ncbi:MBL fold metallo-hydrolase [Candidatus Aerophobetes bacterium]|nr:MBL fold metallo-hydrolase [Candidatus Aerophobetes bacterium]